jgi:alpha-L-glutamate ligase-like protein
MFDFIKNSKKLLGMNARNLDYIRPYNRKKAKNLADSKLASKRALYKGGIPVPKLIAKIRTIEELENFQWSSLPSSFALKPNKGFGGEGILIVYGRKKTSTKSSVDFNNQKEEDIWIKADGSKITVEDLKNHIRNILDGSFSLSNLPDVAFFEERLTLLKLFKPYAYKGIPDVRIIVFNKIPVMAMLRLPTKESGGKANLQQGGIGVGIDMATGVTTTAVLGKNKIIEYVPGTRMLLSGIKIPYWKEMLLLAVKAQEISGMGFLGADVAIDRERGPVFLEINARPGLSIQIANLSGLKERLERIKGLKIKTPERGVRVGRDIFGGEIEEELEEISGKKVIGTVEKVKLIGKNEKEIEVEARIDTGAGLTSIDIDIAKQIGFEGVADIIEREDIRYDEIKNLSKEERENIFKKNSDVVDTAIIHSSHGTTYRPVVRLEILMDGVVISAKVTIISRSHLQYPMIIGKKNLSKFLIDVNK